MSSISTVSAVESAVVVAVAIAAPAALVWQNKAGKVKSAASLTSQAFAPLSARIGAAQAQDVRLMLSGTYAPFLVSVRAALKKADIAALIETEDFTLAPTNKAGVLACLRAIDAQWSKNAAAAALKDKKLPREVLALRETMGAFFEGLELQDAEREAAKAAKANAERMASMGKQDAPTDGAQAEQTSEANAN